MESIISNELITFILGQYELSVKGIHGVSHWARVLENGLRLAPQTGANTKVVELFALFHDSRRINDSRDNGHGVRGAELAASLRGIYFELTDQEFSLLDEACRLHTDGMTDSDPTVQTCWDSDRLDLGRVNIVINPKYLCTAAAKDEAVIQWADQRARTQFQPELILNDWQITEIEDIN